MLMLLPLSLPGQAQTPPRLDVEALALRLQQDAARLLDDYLALQGWQASRVEREVWLAPAASHLPPCLQAPDLQAGGLYRQPWGRRPYLVSCAEPQWQLRARVDVRVFMPLWVTAKEIDKGQPIRAHDLVAKELEVSRIQRGFTPASVSLTQQKSSRRLRTGQLIGELDLQKQWAVRQGEGVLIRAGQGAFAATTRGEALEDGAIGDGIRVKNSSSGRVIQAWVLNRGEVETRF
ncbi:flagellar basal body P-ring formation chaperone FlgA [Aeromonas bivalvium]|uniref:flagellar basal body P-ring formation chaperone FlgA n=1 Tax=Aeromonas bivalvium TaxID=440079 RepID=UPI00370B6C45